MLDLGGNSNADVDQVRREVFAFFVIIVVVECWIRYVRIRNAGLRGCVCVHAAT